MRMRLEGGTVRAGCAALLLGVTVLTAVPPTRAGERVDLAAAAVHRSPVAPAVAGAPAAAPRPGRRDGHGRSRQDRPLARAHANRVVGNPMIADITVQKHGILVVTGKAYGVTDLIALDGAGAMLAESLISVQAASESVVTVQGGLSANPSRARRTASRPCTSATPTNISPNFKVRRNSATASRPSRAARRADPAPPSRRPPASARLDERLMAGGFSQIRP